MEIFKCQYIKHQNEEIIGFCLNQNCQKATQYCYYCVNVNHQGHFDDCIRFTQIIQFINESILIYNQLKDQLIEISSNLQNRFIKSQKKIDQEVNNLENMRNSLQHKDYLTFKSQIQIVKSFYSKENQNYIQQQISSFNNILDTIKDLVPDQNKREDQFNSDFYYDIKFEEINQDNDNKQQNIQDAQRMLNEGLSLYKLKQYQQAIEYFDQAISLNPQYDSAWINKGQALDNLNQYEEAIKCFDRAISINPESNTAWQAKGIVLGYLNQHQEAIECFEKAISINPELDDPWYQKGLGLCYQNQYQKAIDCFDKAISIHPQQNFAWENKGTALYKLKQYQAAIECFNKAIAINPDQDAVWNNKGSALRRLKKYKEAIQDFDKAILINPNWDTPWNNKGLALSNLNKYQEAIVCYDKAISINPNSNAAWINKGFALHHLKKYKDAITIYDKALSICINPQILKRKADSLFELGNKQEAEKFYLAALEKGVNENDEIQKLLSKL